MTSKQVKGTYFTDLFRGVNELDVYSLSVEETIQPVVFQKRYPVGSIQN